MAVVIQEDFRGQRPRFAPQALQGLISFAGAVTSVSLVIGLAVWGYQLAMRDVSGIPVVRAMAGPMRVVAPEPGGVVFPNTGLTVNGLVGKGAEAPLPDQVVLAPLPGDLSVEDQPVSPGSAATLPEGAAGVPPDRGTAAPQTALAVPAAPGEPPAAPPLAGQTETVRDTAMEASVEAALAEALGAEPMQSDTLAMADPVSPGAMTRSPRPQQRPEGDSSAEPVTVAAVAPVPGAAQQGGEVDVASIPAGTRLVQLGAFDDDATARAEWIRLQAKFGDLIAPKAMVLQTAESGGQRFVRLRALGFEDDADARRFCSALLAENAECIPVTYRP